MDECEHTGIVYWVESFGFFGTKRVPVVWCTKCKKTFEIKRMGEMKHENETKDEGRSLDKSADKTGDKGTSKG